MGGTAGAVSGTFGGRCHSLSVAGACSRPVTSLPSLVIRSCPRQTQALRIRPLAYNLHVCHLTAAFGAHRLTCMRLTCEKTRALRLAISTDPGASSRASEPGASALKARSWMGRTLHDRAPGSGGQRLSSCCMLCSARSAAWEFTKVDMQHELRVP